MESSSRRPTSQEITLIDFLVVKAKLKMAENWKEQLQVAPMDDGGMGSLVLLLGNNPKPDRQFGRQASEHQFKDADGVDVIATLNVDTEEEPFELDVWKMDYSPLIKLPDRW